VGKAKEEGVTLNIIANNRAGGNAPLIAKELASKVTFLRPEKREVLFGKSKILK